MKIVVKDYFFSGIGETLYKSITTSSPDPLKIIKEIYDGIKIEMDKRLANQDSIANLARDIYGGITGDQVGEGHGHYYWFYEKNDPDVQKLIKKEGDRKTQISHEAFAGYFEYIVMDISAGIDPAKKVLPKTIKAFRKNDGGSLMNKKVKWLAVLFVILAIACNAEDCTSLVGLDKLLSPEVSGPHVPTEPAPLLSYSDVTKIHFRETFGGYFEVDAMVEKDKIWYQCFKQDVLRESEPKVISGTFECGESAWNEFMAVFDNNQVNAWKEQGYYLNQYFNQQSTLFEEWPEVEFVEEGDFFNVTDSPSGYDLLYLPCYFGIDQNEKKFRSNYNGFIELYTNHDESPSLWRAYESYGLPKGYNRFRKELWDLIVGHTGMPDWRHELGDWGRENLYKKYPYMLREDQERKIRYFSLLENYGGKESSMGISLVYDGGGKSILYKCFSDKKIYSVGRSGVPVLYCKRVYEPTGKLKSETEVLELPEGLPEILERYEVDKWEAETGGTEWVRQGEFYNIKNAKEVKNTREQELRSGYDALLHVVYTNGEHVELQLENGRLPEAYNDFRDELWDYMIPYINEGRSEEKQVVDWREFIDQWGAEFLYETR